MRLIHTLLVKNYELWERSPRYQRFVYYTNLPAGLAIREAMILGGFIEEWRSGDNACCPGHKPKYRAFRQDQLAEMKAFQEAVAKTLSEVQMPCTIWEERR